MIGYGSRWPPMLLGRIIGRLPLGAIVSKSQCHVAGFAPTHLDRHDRLPKSIVSRIAPALESMRQLSRAALVPYLVAGDPRPEATVPCMHALVQAGANLIELGVPFSDPMAEGPVIQRAHERALAHRVGVGQVLEMVAEFREVDERTPVVLMGYANSLLRTDSAGFARAAHAVGADGVLVVDMPIEETDATRRVLRAHELDMILLVSVTTPPDRARRIAKAAQGFLYYLAFKGITGAAGRLAPDDRLSASLNALSLCTDVPIGVGFGIRTTQAAALVAGLADLVIVGSVLVECIAKLRDAPVVEITAALGQCLADLRAACDTACDTGRPHSKSPLYISAPPVHVPKSPLYISEPPVHVLEDAA